MIKVKLKTGEIKEVSKNIAHGLIEAGEAELYVNRMMEVNSKVKRKKVNAKLRTNYTTKS